MIINKAKLGSIANYLAAGILLILGGIYLLKDSFMPYHSDAVLLKWDAVDRNFQILIIALMKAVSGGYIATAFAIFILQRKFSTSRIVWIPGLILILGLIVSFTSLYATFIVRFNSPGKPPTFLALLGLALILISYVANRKTIK